MIRAVRTFGTICFYVGLIGMGVAILYPPALRFAQWLGY